MDEERVLETTSVAVMRERRQVACSRGETWIIVCEHFHGAVGPIPTEQLALDLAAQASDMGDCTYRPVRLALAQDHVEGSRGERDPDPLNSMMPERPSSRGPTAPNEGVPGPASLG